MGLRRGFAGIGISGRAVRCGRCGRLGRPRRTRRGPDGRLLFDWCDACLADVHLRSLGLRTGSALGPHTTPSQAGRHDGHERARGLRTLGLLLVVWGLVLESAAAAMFLGPGPRDDGIGLSVQGRLRLFALAGVLLSGLGAFLGLSTVDHAARRRAALRTIEVGGLALAVGLLAVGIAFEDARRSPRILAGVAVSLAASALAGRWARRRAIRERSDATG